MKKAVFTIALLLGVGIYQVSAQSALWATQATFIDGVTDDESKANEHGVFPVELTWEVNKDCDYYNVARYNDYERTWKVIDAVKNDGSALNARGRARYIDNNKDSIPNKEYKYHVTGVSSAKGTIAMSNECTGYGALTALCYMNTYNESISASHHKLTLMNKRYALSKLGKETITGDMTGEVFYHARVRGFGGVVTLSYRDFEEYPGWVLRGNTDVKANIWANGKMLKTVQCVGMYPGAVNYDHIKIKKGKAKGGYYTISRYGFQDVTIEWDAIDTEIRGDYKECDVPDKSFKGVNAASAADGDDAIEISEEMLQERHDVNIAMSEIDDD